jgi:hypothetical protein
VSKNSTDAGRMISTKPALRNARLSIHDNLDPDSNVTEERDSQKEKYFSPQTLIDAGRMISIKPV